MREAGDLRDSAREREREREMATTRSMRGLRQER